VKVHFLGTGTSQGVPVIGCQCKVCQSSNPKDQRLRTSVLIQTPSVHFVIDTGPDFRQQMLRIACQRLDAVLYTHSHKDHIAGMDDIRAFNYLQKKPMDLYATQAVQAAIKQEFHYVFSTYKYPGIPEVKLIELENKPFQLGDETIIPIQLMHHKMPVLGFRIRDFVYITDANYIAAAEKEKIKGCRILVLNALRREKHISHFNLEEAIALADEFGAQTTYLTHISHQLGLHDAINQELSENKAVIELAYDGMQLDL
jgi:phosphoribosyl 1,2-cyclic phosphate phosphodiesterase